MNLTDVVTRVIEFLLLIGLLIPLEVVGVKALIAKDRAKKRDIAYEDALKESLKTETHIWRAYLKAPVMTFAMYGVAWCLFLVICFVVDFYGVSFIGWVNKVAQAKAASPSSPFIFGLGATSVLTAVITGYGLVIYWWVLLFGRVARNG